MQSLTTRFIFLTSFIFRVYLLLYAVGEKETTVTQTPTDVVLLAVSISVLCVGIPEIVWYFVTWPVNAFRYSFILCTLMFMQCPNVCRFFPSTDSEFVYYSPNRLCSWDSMGQEFCQRQETFHFTLPAQSSHGLIQVPA